MWQRLVLLSVLVLAVAAFSFPPPPPGDWEADESGEGDGFGAGFPFGRRHGGRGRWPWPPRPHHHRRFPPPPPPPPFLRNVSREARKEFFEIFRDHNLTRRELRGKVDEWAQKQGDDIVKSVKDFETKLDNFKKDLKANITQVCRKQINNKNQVVNDLPSAIETLGKIYDNEDLTPSQVREQTREALKKLDKKTARAVFAVIFSVFKPPFPPGPPGPPGFGIKDKRIRIMIGGGGPDFGPFGGFGGFGGPGPFGGPFGPGPVRPPPPPPPAPETSTSEGPDDDFFEIFGRPDEENGVDDA